MFFIRAITILLLAAALFSGNIAFLKSKIFGSLTINTENNKLSLENESLKAELYSAQNLNNKQEKAGEWSYLHANIFSTYPFNDQDIISINSGTLNGIAVNEAVAAAPSVLLGQIISANNRTSVVRTIFDKNFIAAVKIGDNKINALLKGGASPTLEMIDKNSDIKNGDIVYNADKNFPYGFKLGEVKIINANNTSGPFKEALLNVKYNPAFLNEVLVVTNFKPANVN
jgi:cell shape-determining protein MreC